MEDKRKRKEILILNILKKSKENLSSSRVAEELAFLGHEMSERTVRLYLQQMDAEGLTESNGKRGHIITVRGKEELESFRIIEKIGFLSAKIDQLSYRMNFSLNTTSGTVLINITIVEADLFAKKIPLIHKIYENGYTMGQLLTL